MEKIVIGLVGEKGGGKETFTNSLHGLITKEATLLRLRFGDIISDLLIILDIPRTRENMQKIPLALIECFGKDTITIAMKRRIKKSEATIVVLDGIRTFSDAEMLRSFPHSKLVYISASQKIRYERMKKRKEKVGEGAAPFSKFLEEERAEIEMEIPKIGAKDEFKIENNKSRKELENTVRDFFEIHINKAR